MGILIKTQTEIDLMRIAGKRHGEILKKVRDFVRAGITTADIDDYVAGLIAEYGDIAAFKNYTPEGITKPFPRSICTSVNSVIVHGIPDEHQVLVSGDVISVDIGINHGGVFTDAAITVPVGEVSQKILDMIYAAEQSLYAGIEKIKPGNTVGDIGYAIEQVIKRGKYGIVDGFSGHGVGRYIHEDPYIPNYGKRGAGAKLKPNMTIAIEPMLTLGSPEWYILSDEYTTITRDKSVAVHVEHTVLVTETGYEILTLEPK
jgi:methionyl aminopeptidase